METNQSDPQINLSPTEWLEKFTLISQEEFDSPDKIDDEGLFNKSCETKKKLKAQCNRRIIRMAPLFVNQPRFEKICRHWENEFVTSCFKTLYLRCHSAKNLHANEKKLKYIINLCGFSLTCLNIRYGHYPFNSQIMPLIKTNCPNLKDLQLHLKKIKSQDFKNCFSNMSHLERLSIDWDCENSTLPKSLVKSLEKVGGTLKFLRLENKNQNNRIRLPYSLATAFSKLIVLNDVLISHFGLSQSIIDAIGEKKHLTRLVFMFCWHNDKKMNMYPIGNLKNLMMLLIDCDCDCGDTDEFFNNLCNNAEKLKSLFIIGITLTDNAMISLGNLKELNTLDFSLKKHSLNESGKTNECITDEPIKYLFNEKLNSLDLSNRIEITNSSVIKVIENLPNLTSLDLENTKVTDDVINEMSKLIKYREKPLWVNVSFDDYDDIFELGRSVNVNFRTSILIG